MIARRYRTVSENSVLITAGVITIYLGSVQRNRYPNKAYNWKGGCHRRSAILDNTKVAKSMVDLSRLKMDAVEDIQL